MVSKILHYLYRIRKNRIRTLILKIIYHLERGEFYSITLREIFKDYHGVDIGLYSHGGCFQPDQIASQTKIGRYCSIARSARVFNRNHPMEFISMHGFFFTPVLGIVSQDPVKFIPLEIGNDVWLGHNSIIMPNVRKIGTGAVVAAGAVVNKDVPPYAVVVGNPARVVRYRFSPETIEKLLASKWWEKSIEEIKNNELEEYIKPYEGGKFDS